MTAFEFVGFSCFGPVHLLCGPCCYGGRGRYGVGGSHVHVEFDTYVDAEALLIGLVCSCRCSAAGEGRFRYWKQMNAGTRKLLTDTVDTGGEGNLRF